MAKAGRAAATWRAYREVSKPGSPGLLTRFKAVPRMIRGTLKGNYPHLGKGQLAMFAAGLAYIVSPVDAIPDFLIGIGVVDDFGVLIWLVSSMLAASGRYVEWEREDLELLRQKPRA
ncbi:YkvA family protein [Microtetraspora niveoalba]|uniref:YkvA family protein n=1 Tax=Microtetraspora niveoalba TaxID=46175 RepID=UPI000835BB0B|nr:YkvA family protein [Microtetraspora niveoalba]